MSFKSQKKGTAVGVAEAISSAVIPKSSANGLVNTASSFNGLMKSVTELKPGR